MTISSSITHRSRRGLTLIELLVVAFILVLFVAVAAPLMRPATADRKVREAARQLNAYIAEAKAFAAQRGRPVGLAFDRVAATGEAARNSNIVTRMYLAQSPPHYTGDLLSSTVTIVGLGSTSTTGNTVPAQKPNWFRTSGTAEVVPPEINNTRAIWYQVTRNATQQAASAMLDVIIDSYIPESASSGFVPFRIRIGSKGNFYDGYVYYVNGSPRTYQYYFWAPYGTRLFDLYRPPPTGYTLTTPYEIQFFPQMSTDSPLELPTGTVVDLQYSGFGQSGRDFFDISGTSSTPMILVFSPSGEVEQVVNGGSMTNRLSRIHFLVGTLEKAVDAPAVTDPDDIHRASNLNDRAAQWVSLNTRTGHVTTADNLGFDTDPPDPRTLPLPINTAYMNAAITQARGFATGLNTKGGR